MQRIAAIIQNERDWHGPDRGRTLSPAAIDKADEDSLAAVTQYGVRFHLCATPYQDDEGAEHVDWYVKRVSLKGASIPTRISLARDPVSDELLAAFGLSLEEAYNRIAQVPSRSFSGPVSEAISEAKSEEESAPQTRWEIIPGGLTIIDVENDPEYAPAVKAAKERILAERNDEQTRAPQVFAGPDPDHVLVIDGAGERIIPASKEVAQREAQASPPGTEGLIKCPTCGEYTSPGLDCSACGTYLDSPTADGPAVRQVAAILGVDLDSVPVSVRSTERELPLVAEELKRSARLHAGVELSPEQAEKLALVVAVGGGVTVDTSLRDGSAAVLLHAHGEELNHRFVLTPAGRLIPEDQDVAEFDAQSLAAVANAPDGCYDDVRQRARAEVLHRLELAAKKALVKANAHRELEAIVDELEHNDCILVAAAHEPGEEPFWTVLAVRRRPVFPALPYVVWDYNYSGLSGGHYDLDRFTGYRRFNQHVADREEV